MTNNLNKQSNYQSVLNGYKTFWGRKTIIWFQPPTTIWNYNGLDISLNPELGLNINGTYHVIKMYFKADKLSKVKSELILYLMHQVLPAQVNGHNVIYGIIDVRNSNHIIPNGFNAKTIAALQGEAQYINTAWPSL